MWMATVRGRVPRLLACGRDATALSWLTLRGSGRVAKLPAVGRKRAAREARDEEQDSGADSAGAGGEARGSGAVGAWAAWRAAPPREHRAGRRAAAGLGRFAFRGGHRAGRGRREAQPADWRSDDPAAGLDGRDPGRHPCRALPAARAGLSLDAWGA